ncbi:unnamed protein product [Brassica oleracea var. botrytis]
MCSIYKVHDEAKYKVFMRWISDESKWEHQLNVVLKMVLRNAVLKLPINHVLFLDTIMQL